MTLVNLPGLWFDKLTEVTTAGLFVVNTYPESGSVNASAIGSFVFDLLCTNGNNVDLSATDVFVNGVQAYDGGTSSWINSFTGTVTRLSIPSPLLDDWRMEDSGVTSWPTGNSPTVTKQPGTPAPLDGTQVIRVAYNATAFPWIYQAKMTIGKVYMVTGYARGDGTTGRPRVYDGGTSLFYGTTSNTWQTFSSVFTASSTDLNLFNYASGGWSEYDNIKLVELGSDYRFEGQAPAAWSSEQVITVRVVSADDGGPIDTLDTNYSFIVEDTVAPKLLSALATYATTIRATFDEGMLAISSAGATDALNPSNYTIAYVPANDRQAAVSVSVTAVTQISATVFDLTTDIELTFWRNYLLTCGAIADDSSNANALDIDYRTAGFAAWTPPEWPETRRFRIWNMLAQQNRDDDVTGDLERLVDCWQDIVWLLLWDADRIEQIWDVDRAPEIFIDARLQDLGNPHSFDLTELQKRKLLDVLVPSYRQHGTEDAIINLVRFFLGITVTILPYNSFDYRWVLGEDTLGQGTYLGPGDGDPALYTFVIQSLTDLTTEQRRWIGLIADATKVAHEHYEIKDPSDAVTFDHWELGYSRLDLETILH